MAYSRTDWVTGVTPLSATNLNNIEDGIYLFRRLHDKQQYQIPWGKHLLRKR